MKISLIVAMDRQRAIGREGKIPWRLSSDMKFFKTTTMGKPVIMGRKTWESLGRPLPGRLNIVITRSTDYMADGATIVHTPDAALQVAEDAGEVMIIGGAEIYALFLPKADQLYLTQVDTVVEGADAWFPEYAEEEWKQVAEVSVAADERNSSSFRIRTLLKAS